MQNPRFRKGLHHNVPVTLNICTGQAVQNNTTTTGAKCSQNFILHIWFFSQDSNKKRGFVEDRCVNKGYTKTAISTLILAQTCADCFESCITMYYLIPSARRKFDAESKVLQGFSSQQLHQNGHINSFSGSNLRRALRIMYHHVIHDSKCLEQV